jgi:hypothetical protein
MGHPTVVAGGRVQTWIRRSIKQRLDECLYDNLSNRTKHTEPVPSAAKKKLPTTVVNKVSDKFERGVQCTTALWVGKPSTKVIGGPNTAEGNEKKVSTKMVRVYYNNQRFPLQVGDESVAGDAQEFYQMADDTSKVISDLFTEQTEYDYNRAMCEGADELLTESEYWEDSDKGSEITTPMSKVIHPNVYVSTASVSKVTYSETYSTYETSIQTAATALTSSHGMSMANLDAIWLRCTRTVIPIMGTKYRKNGVKWVVIMSDASYQQLITSTTSNASFRDILKHCKDGMEDLITGSIGIYRNMLLIVAQRQPVYNVAGSAGSRFEYVTPEADNRTRAQTTDGSTADGSAELTYVAGNGAWMHATVKSMDYKHKGFDYDFAEGMCGQRACGTVRTDLDSTVAPTSARTNESSFIWMTATTTAVA